ncbi:MAG: MgtC/SapB family protein [Chitinivibrionales bacterium]|nr:MgtC/SapB family protein [Chitinivibrionales bacterium]
MTETNLFLRFGVALIGGILVGMQREYALETPDKPLAAGVRTFALVSLLGCAAGLLCDNTHSAWPLVGLALILGAFLSVNYYVEASQGKVGLTTKAALLLTLCIGALAYWNFLALAIALSVAATVVLSIKFEVHSFVQHLTHDDVFAALKFAVISAIILPILPDQRYGVPPFDIFNPRKIWLFVVLISLISFVGYVLVKIVGSKKGIGLTGLFGGLASSTAVTLSFTQRSRENAAFSHSFALAITIAWTVMFLRVMVAVAVLNLALVRLIWIPATASIAVGLLYCLYLARAQKNDGPQEKMVFANPFELGPAIKFGLLFVVILFAAKLAQTYLGTAGIYLSSGFAGLADVDAIALTMAKLGRDAGGIAPVVAARSIILACVANTLLKGGLVIFGGAPALRRAILPGYILLLATGLAFMFFI